MINPHAMMLTTQENHKVKVLMDGGSDDLWVVEQLKGHEEASRPYCYTVDLSSKQANINIKQYVGTTIAIEFDYGADKRYFSGIIGEIEQGLTVTDNAMPVTKYRMKIYPSLWLLKFTQDCQIFQNKSALDIIKEVLQNNGVERLSDKTSGCGTTVREYCVQYRESAFNFVSRLMEEEGIFYYFKHSASGETMVLTDDSLAAPATTAENLSMLLGTVERPYFNHILSLTIAHQVVSNAFSQADYNFETASVKLFSTVSGKGDGGMVYDYPGIYKQNPIGDHLAKNRVQELEWFKQIVRGHSTCPLFQPLYSMGITGHPNAEANTIYVLHKVHHELNVVSTPGQTLYRNYYEAFPADIPFRAPILAPKPVIPSTQTAKVTGKAGEEIWCDEYGRIKVKFHWDQSGVMDEKSSCWIRVAQLWASSGWGGLWTPRVGMEVVVTFLEGDPDRPLITGCVYNSDNMPPYAADEPTKSTIKSNSTKNAVGYNEFRFEDLAGAEEIFTHAQKDKNSIVEDNRTLRINDGDDTTDIMAGDRTVTLHAEDRSSKGKSPNRGNDTLILSKGSRKIFLKAEGPNNADHLLDLTRGDGTLHITKGNQIINLDDGDQNFTVNGNVIHTVTKDYTLTITGNLTINVTGNISIVSGSNISMTAAQSITIAAGTSLAMTSGSGMNLSAGTSFAASAPLSAKLHSDLDATVSSDALANVTAGAAMSITAGGSLDAKGASVSVTSDSGMSLESGATLTANASASATLSASGTMTITGATVNIN